MDTPLGRRIGKYGNTPFAQQLLQGEYDEPGFSAEVGILVQSFRMDPSIRPFMQKLTPKMYKEALANSQRRSPLQHLIGI